MQFATGRKASAEHVVGFGEGISVVVDVVGSSAGSRVGTCEGAVDERAALRVASNLTPLWARRHLVAVLSEGVAHEEQQ